MHSSHFARYLVTLFFEKTFCNCELLLQESTHHTSRKNLLVAYMFRYECLHFETPYQQVVECSNEFSPCRQNGRFSSNSNYLTKMWVAPEWKVFIDSMRYSKSTLNACHVSSVHVVERKMEGMKQSLLHYLLLCNPRSFVVNFIFHQNTVFVLASNFLCKARNTGNQRTKQWKNFFDG